MIVADVEIGLERTSYTTDEGGGTVEVCARLTRGTLERQVLVDLAMTDDTAIGNTNNKDSFFSNGLDFFN